MSKLPAFIRLNLLAMALAWVTGLTASPMTQQTFASPEAGVDALVQAAKTNNVLALEAILGPDSGPVISSGDLIEDTHGREVFLRIYDVEHVIVYQDDAHVTLLIGRSKRRMPIPLIKDSSGWRFDTAHGQAQILQQRIKHNELNAMQVCLAIVYAERQYAAGHAGADGTPIYTARFHSSPGQHDGLYWPTASGEQPSLLGVLLADAAIHDGYEPPGVSTAKPYLGYVYRIVMQPTSDASTAHVTHAERFVVMAYPALYSVSGIRSFVAGADGVVYGKDLGAYTANIVATTPGLLLDDGWQVSRPAD
jgi:hypothetical protein